MKLIKAASGKRQIKISKKEWEGIGKKAGWIKKKAGQQDINQLIDESLRIVQDLNNPEYVGSVTEFNPQNPSPRDIYTAFQVITRTIASQAKELYDNLEQILKIKPELHQEINALIANESVGGLAFIGNEAGQLYSQGAMGSKGQENGATQKLMELINNIKSSLPRIARSVSNTLNQLKQEQVQPAQAQPVTY